MESLPPELISRILVYIIDGRLRSHPGISLAPYATLSRRWQAQIERCTFSYIYITTPRRLEEFERLLWTPRRRSCVRFIQLVVELESYDEKARAHFETDEERQRNDEIFTTTIGSLFKILSDWPANLDIGVDIKAQSPGDYLALKDPKERRQRKRAAAERVNDLLNKRYERSYLKFSRTTTETECPVVPAVTGLSIWGAAKGRLIEPASSVFIASKLPRLNRVDLEMQDDCRRDEQLRQLLRSDFARNLDLFPGSVQRFGLRFFHAPPRNQNYLPPDITEDGVDILSSQLRTFSQRLERLEINDSVVGPELFWPSTLPGDNLVNPPFWPLLIEVSVKYMEITPSGEWLLDRDPGETPEDSTDDFDATFGDEEDSYPEYVRIPLQDRKSKFFRTRIIAGHIDRLYASAGRAALRMPKLRWMTLQNVGPVHYSLEYEVQAGLSKLTWRNQDLTDGPYEPDALVRREKAKSLYQPDEEVFEIWRNVAIQHTGRDVEIEFKEWGC